MKISGNYRRILGVIVLFLVGIVSYAQNGFYSTVNAKKVIVGSTIEYSIVADNVKSAKNFNLPDFGGLKLISGPMQSNSTTIINGQRTSKQSLVYTLLASKAGVFTIGKANGIINGKKTFSNSIRIEVVQNKKGVALDGKENKMFVRLEAASPSIYIGQQLTLSYVIYTQVSVQSVNILKESDYNGFYVEENVRYSRANSIKEINGIQYHTSVLKQVCLYPQQTGTYNFEEAVFKIGIADKNQQNSRSLFFRSNLNYHNATTNALKVLVKEVPDPIPSDYIGGVGKYSINAQLDRRTVQNNKAFNLTVIIKGDGDPKMFNPPVLNLKEDFEVYEPILLQENKVEEDNVQVFSKKYQYTIVPKKEGRFYITPEYSFYNPDSIRYEQIRRGPFPIEVTKGKVIEQIVDHTVIKEYRADWNIKVSKPSPSIYNSTGFNGFLWISLCCLIGMFGTKFYQESTAEGREKSARKKEIHAKAIAKLIKAKSLMEAGDERVFHDEIFKTIQNYLSEKFEMEIGSVTSNKVSEVLSGRNIEQNIIESINRILKNAQLAIFGGMSENTMQEIYDELADIITKLEN